jgi:hypothetical protein
MSKTGKEHWTIVKRVFKYLCGTTNYAICYQGRPQLDKVIDVQGFVDAHWARDLDCKRSTSRYAFNSFEAINWMSKRQALIVLTTIEVEYMKITHPSKEVVWL